MLQSTTPQTNLSASPYHAMHSLTYNTFSLIYETIDILELQFYCKFLKKSFSYTSEIHQGFSTARLPWSTMAPGLKVFQSQWLDISCINNVTEKFRWAYKHIHSTMYKHTHNKFATQNFMYSNTFIYIFLKSNIILKFLIWDEYSGLFWFYLPFCFQ